MGLAIAQNKQVTGIVTDETGSPVIGASVIVKGTTTGTVTDINGKYSLNVPSTAKTLEISYLGMKTQTVTVGDNLRISLTADSKALEEVVVTAMGITRSEKALGYSVGVVKSDELSNAREGNIINSLAGKVAGVNVTQFSGTAGGSSKIILRGQSSLGSSGQPLFVVDGMPVSNSTLSGTIGINGGIDTGSRIGDLSSDDIESMNVLKGAAATALYGARAKDGVIVITTKKGQKNSKAVVSVNSSFRMEDPLVLPSLQNEYGPGNGATGAYSTSAWNGWGPKISDVQDQQFPIFTGDKVTLQAYPDNIKDFYNTGKTYTNNVSVAGGDDKNDFRIGFTALNQTGIVPNNKYDKYNFTFNGGRDFSNKFSARIAVSYINASSEGRPAQGSNDKNVIIPTINTMPRTLDINLLKDNWITSDGKPYSLGSGITSNNPYWVLNKNKFTDELDRIIGNIIVTYKPIQGLTITNNLGTDFFNDNSRRVWAYNTLGVTQGRFVTYNWETQIINNDLIASYEFSPMEDFGIKVLVGENIMQNTMQRTTINSQDLLVADIYTYANAKSNIPSYVYRQNRLIGLFGDIGFSYKNFAYINITGRNDWSSTMPKSNQSYFYPSVSGSLLFTELMEKNDILNYGKVRLNYAVVGSDTAPYQLDYVFSPENSYFIQYLGSTAGQFPHGGLLAYSSPRVYPDPNLKPQMQSAFEIGADLRFFQGRITLDATYYSNKTKDVISEIDAPNSSGYFNFRKNAGEITNKGIELMLGLTPIKGDFTWDINLNFATNEQKVTKLDPTISELNLTSGYNGLQVKAAVGEPFSIYGMDWERDGKGNIIIESNGLRRTTATAVNLGSINPDYTLGINNTLNFKNFTLGFLIDIRQGGVMYSGTVGDLRTAGVAKETLLNGRKPIVDVGVMDDGSGNYVPNTKEVSAYNYWSQNYKSQNAVANIFDASYVKLRELVLSYDIPASVLKNIFIKKASIGFEARNLWIISSEVPHIDPELSFFSPDDVGSGVEFSSIPTTRSFGVNLKVDF